MVNTFKEKEMIIQTIFDHPLYISSAYDYDKLYIKFIGSTKFIMKEQSKMRNLDESPLFTIG
jgi:hypothetical protein